MTLTWSDSPAKRSRLRGAKRRRCARSFWMRQVAKSARAGKHSRESLVWWSHGTPIEAGMKRHLRNARSGGLFLLGEAIGRIPSQSLRTWLARKLLRVTMGKGVALYRWREIRSGHLIKLEQGATVGMWATLDGRRGITIGRNANLSSEVMLWTLQHDPHSDNFGVKGGPIVIEDYAWISARAIILP